MPKLCPRCHSQLPLSAFTRDASRADGLSFYCRACTNELRGRKPKGPLLRAATDAELRAEMARRGLSFT